MDVETEIRPWPWRALAIRVGGLSLVYALVGLAAGGITTWGLLFLVGLALVSVPQLAIERWGARSPTPRRAGVTGLVVALVVSVWVVFLVVQVTYSHGLVGSGDPRQGLQAAGVEANSLPRYDVEVLAVLLSVSLPFALTSALRLRVQRLDRVVGFVVLASLAISYAYHQAIGFRGLPQPGWLLRLSWFPPSCATVLAVHPLLVSMVLPLLAALGDRSEDVRRSDPAVGPADGLRSRAADPGDPLGRPEAPPPATP